MDGETTIYGQHPDEVDPTSNETQLEYTNNRHYYVGDFTSNASDITSNIPLPISHHGQQDGSTFTQQALRRADMLLSDSNKSPDHHNKIVITITDGEPTISYNDDGYIWGSGFS